MLLALCAAAVAALAAGPFLYRSLLPRETAGVEAGCSFVLVTGALFVLLVAALVWQLRRRRRPRQVEMDRRLWEAVMGDEAPPPDDNAG